MTEIQPVPTLVDAMLAAAGESDPIQVLKGGLQIAMEYAGAQASLGLWFDEGDVNLATVAGEVHNIPDATALREMCQQWHARGCHGHLVSGSTADDCLNLLHGSLGVGELYVIPLGRGLSSQGCLALRLTAGAEMDADRERGLRHAAAQLGLAVELCVTRQQLVHQQRLTQTLYNVSYATATMDDLDALLSLIVRAAIDTVGNAENCVLHLLDRETGELRPRALSYSGVLPAERGGRSHMHAGEGVAGHALLLGQVVNAPDVSRDPRFVRVEQGRRFAAMMSAPLIMGEHKIGTLSVDSRQAHAFRRDDERLLSMLANHAAAAIQNARLMLDLQKSLAELTDMQDHLIQAEKLSALGRMIGGITHELNNPLAAVMGYAQLLQMSEHLDEESRHDVDRIYRQAERAARIVRNLQMFSRQEPAVRQLVDVNEILESVLELQATQLRMERIEVSRQLDPRPLGVQGDYNHLQQVFFHIISNARDAMVAHRGGGHLEVVSRHCGETIEVRITDDGLGISEEAKTRIFDPFFSTKEVGEGTGLGLSVCYGIVTNHGGTISIETAEGRGTTFVIVLPADL